MKNIPYIDLHCHLDGSITLDIARKLASLQNIELPADDAELEAKLSVPESCESLNEFLECFALPCRNNPSCSTVSVPCISAGSGMKAIL